MASLARIKQIHEKFASKATFLTVYVGGNNTCKWGRKFTLFYPILEAHPVENEDFQNKFEIKIHQNLSERLDAASTKLK